MGGEGGGRENRDSIVFFNLQNVKELFLIHPFYHKIQVYFLTALCRLISENCSSYSG